MEFVLNSIDQSGPGGLDDVFAYTDGVPGVVLIGAFDVHLGRSGLGICVERRPWR